ncbi:MAG: T9SS type A sorting domain-containing protein [Ignavibacteria bacterium]|nr:MAG: T9SS type A sorting domain-containing protein [Ignavibacteria bacterium]
MVGGPGKILRTTNGGAVWSEQTSGVTNFLYGVSFTDANRGTAVGTQGLILRTTNGGSTWSSQSSGTLSYFFGVSFIDANTGFAVGSGGTIARTTNGGADWTIFPSRTSNNLYAVSVLDTNRGIIVGGNGSIVLLTDTGMVVTRVREPISGIPQGFQLYQNFPNPFNSNTTIEFEINAPGFISLTVYDLLGRKISTLAEGVLEPGVHRRTFDGSSLGSGIYFYRLETVDRVRGLHERQTRKLLLIR